MQELDVGKNIYYNESGPSLDMGRLAKNLISKLWIMLLVGAIFSGAAFAIAKATYVETYKALRTIQTVRNQLRSIRRKQSFLQEIRFLIINIL